MKYCLAVFVLLFLHLVILLNLQFTAWPEMFSYPYLLSNGFRLYRDIGLPYQPLLPIILEKLFKLFGYNLFVLQIFTWLLILINDCMIFLISIKLTGKKLISLAPLVIYVLFQTLTEGNMLWFDLATTPFILLGVLSILFFKDSQKYFLFGICLSLAFFIKQQTGILYVFLIVYLVYNKKFREIFFLFVGSLVPAIFVIFYILSNNTLTDYIFWTIEVPVFWYPKFPGYVTLPSIKETFLVVLLSTPVLLPSIKLLRKDTNFGIVFFLFLGAFFTAFPRFAFFRFQPALALYTLLLIYVIPTLSIKIKFLISIILTLIFSLLLKHDLQFLNLPARFYGESEYNMSKSLSNFILPKETTYLLNEHSLFYLLTGTVPTKPWIDNYVWYMEIEGMQDKVIGGLNKNPPRLIFRKNPKRGNWYNLGVYEPIKIVEYIKLNYEKIDEIGEIEVWKKR